MIDLNPTQAATRITTLLGTPESRTLDFKRISAKHSRMIETVCAFANSEGIEIESPGAFPGNITVANIGRAGSKARNALIALNLREFDEAPNIDAGEGVRMMFAEMAAAKLYPPQYAQNLDAAVESVTVTLLNLERPTVWDEVSAWIDAHGSIANRDLRGISTLDTLEASRLLRAWVTQGVLIALPAASRQQARYAKPERPEDQPGLFSSGADNEAGIS